MSKQLDLEWMPSDRDRRLWVGLRDTQQKIIRIVTPKEAAFRLNLTPENLLHSLAERDRHHLKYSTHPGMCELAQQANLALEYGNELLRPLGLVAGAEVPLTPEQKLARLESAVAKLGMAGDWALREAGLK